MAARICVYVVISCALLGGCATSNVSTGPMMNAIDTTMGQRTKTMQDNLILVTMRNDVHGQLTQGEAIKAEDRLPPRYAGFLAMVGKKYGVRRVADWPLSSLGIRCLVFTANNPQQRDAVAAALNDEPFVETAQGLQYFKTLSDTNTGYNDPYSTMQHSLGEMQIWQSHQWATGAGVTVAVIDTGLDNRHPEFNGRIRGSYNFVDRDPMHTDIHGTAVAGVIAAKANNSQGMVGVAPEAQLLGLKACWPETNASDHAYCSSFTLAKAMDFAIQQGVQIINLSLAGPNDRLLDRLVQRARRADILVVGAVDKRNPDQFPASVAGVIGVTMDPTSTAGLTDFVSAPGLKVLSTLPDNDYDFYSGSSLSAGHVSGIAALIRQRKPHLPADVVGELLRKTVDKDSGAVNGCRALAAVVTGVDCGAAKAAQLRQ